MTKNFEIDMTMNLEKIKTIITNSDNIIFFGGAGMSTESGIPDFRSSDGIYNKKFEDYPPEYILSKTFFNKHPDIFYEFFREKSLKFIIDAKPNKGHYWLYEKEKEGKLKGIITQNIDGLHQKAGSINVLELHGSIKNNYCNDCRKKFDLNYILSNESIAYCDKCGGIIHPGVVLFEESLDLNLIHKSIDLISNADVLIVAGTSLTVQPAASLINYYNGDKLILIDKNPEIQYDKADFILHGKIGEVLSKL